MANSHPRVSRKYDHHIQRRKKPHQCRWPLDNVKSNPPYDPEVAAKIPIHFMEIDRRKNFIFSGWAPGNVTPVSRDTASEGTETPIVTTTHQG
ncbi:hypothetical protein O181_013239 [Austropuccinia psidii MF-1]|uniref:Uncharacterized protein n=1 Tax=Austropuccinia psidii MF-1 TaxID=1389203 RepID=A0A9Q3BXT9_9BASI|nr:hypothetical protein [Austropuccinia psidii MF-1]